mmetsp:Transcript_23131/g.51002  ORF Transcript_23131/g.51002 Transcript_23131/m.51002 type:complete len:308 (-) Transcript_23131:6-929(-)
MSATAESTVDGSQSWRLALMMPAKSGVGKRGPRVASQGPPFQATWVKKKFRSDWSANRCTAFHPKTAHNSINSRTSLWRPRATRGCLPPKDPRLCPTSIASNIVPTAQRSRAAPHTVGFCRSTSGARYPGVPDAVVAPIFLPSALTLATIVSRFICRVRPRSTSFPVPDSTSNRKLSGFTSLWTRSRLCRTSSASSTDRTYRWIPFAVSFGAMSTKRLWRAHLMTITLRPSICSNSSSRSWPTPCIPLVARNRFNSRKASEKLTRSLNTFTAASASSQSRRPRYTRENPPTAGAPSNSVNPGNNMAE